MFRYFRQALTLLSHREKRRVYLVLVTSALAAVVQTLSILAIMPFIILLANPELAQTSTMIMRIYALAGVDSYHGLLGVLGLFAIVILTAGNMFIAFEQWLSHRFLCAPVKCAAIACGASVVRVWPGTMPAQQGSTHAPKPG